MLNNTLRNTMYVHSKGTKKTQQETQLECQENQETAPEVGEVPEKTQQETKT